MAKQPKAQHTPQRGEIWIVNFNSPVTAPNPPEGTSKSQLPTTGDEIYKPRPAVVMDIAARWEYNLHIVVPLRRWKPRFAKNRYFWIVHLPRDRTNKLNADSGADAFQVKSVSSIRFKKRIGVVTPDQLKLLSDTIAFCIGYAPPSAVS